MYRYDLLDKLMESSKILSLQNVPQKERNPGFLLLPAETGLVLFSVGCPWKQMKKEFGGFLVCKYGE
jgi:hypothetical protein